jgi:hypothetical protein
VAKLATSSLVGCEINANAFVEESVPVFHHLFHAVSDLCGIDAARPQWCQLVVVGQLILQLAYPTTDLLLSPIGAVLQTSKARNSNSNSLPHTF